MRRSPKIILSLGVLTLPAFAIERPTLVSEVPEQNEVGLKEAQSEPWLGLSGDPLPDMLKAHLGVEKGVVVLLVNPGSPAERAGVKEHDVLLRVNERPVGSQLSLKEALFELNSGDEVTLTLMTEGVKNVVKTVLVERPEGLKDARPMAERQWIEPRDKANRDLPQDGGIIPKGRGGLQGLLGQIDPTHQKMIEDMLNDRNRGFDLHRQLNRQLEEMKNQMQQPGNQTGLQLNFNNVMGKGASSNSSSMTIGDNEGSVTMRRSDNKTDVIVKNHEGKVLFEGPYHTEEDKASVDPAIRERIESQNFSMGRSALSLKSLFGK